MKSTNFSYTFFVKVVCSFVLLAGVLPTQGAEQDVKPGLVWVHFNNPDFTRAGELGIDQQINVPEDTPHRSYSKIWMGLLKAPIDGEITFFAETEYVARLFVGKEVVLDGSQPHKGKLTVKKGQMLPLQLKFFHDSGITHVNLYWSWQGHPRELVPLSALWHTEADIQKARDIVAGKPVALPKITGPRKRPGPLYAPMGPSSGRVISDEPIQLRPGPHLFIDDFLIESSSNLERKVNTLKRDPSIPNPLIHSRVGKGDNCFQPFVSVHKDPQTGRFRIWYNTSVYKDKESGTFETVICGLGYMESEDGVNWIRPHRVLSQPDDMKFGVCVLDKGLDYPDPARRYKLAYYSSLEGFGMRVFYSADGLAWKPIAPGLQIPGIDDITHMGYDSPRNRYIATFKLGASAADGYVGKAPKGGASWGGIRRIVGQSVSKDLINWSPPRRIIMPGDDDEGITEFYSIGGLLTRGDLLIGTLKVLRDDLACDPGGPKEGIAYTVLAWTRDGESWIRDKEPFLNRDHTPGSWDHAHAWMDCQLPVGDEVYLYYGGYKGGHKVNCFEERQIGLVRMKRDRYVAREAGNKPATLITPPVIINGKKLTLNVEADKGQVRVQIIDADGKPLSGFSFADSKPIAADSLDAAVRWKCSLAKLKGRPVRIEFSLKNARLFAFDLK